MAILADRRKPVNIYRDGSQTAKIQGKMSAAGTYPARKGASLVTYPARQAWDKLVAPGVNGVINRVGQDRDRQVSGREASDLLYAPDPGFVAKQQSANAPQPAASPGTMRDGIQSSRIDPETQESFQKAMVSNSAVAPVNGISRLRAGTTPLASGSGWMRNESTGETVAIDGSGKISMTDAQGNNIDKMTRLISRRQSMSNHPTAAATGVQQVGNMDVTFDDSVDQAARGRLLRSPVQPTAQINRFNAANSGGQMTQGQVASTNASRILNGGGRQQEEPINTFGDVLRVKKGMAMERLALQKQDAATQQQRADNQLITDNNRLELDAERNGIERLRLGADVANNTAKNDIDRLNITGANDERSANIEAKQLEISQQKETAKLLADYNAATDEKTKNALKDKLIARGVMKQQKPEFLTVKQPGYDGGETVYAVDPTTGALRPAMQGNAQQAAPQSAINALAKNPDMKQDFLAKYGYLPSGY